MDVQRINDKASISILVAVMPWEGIKLPKAVIVSQSLVSARYLESMVVEKITIELKPDEQLVQTSSIDEDQELATFAGKSVNGVIKVGENVSYKDILVNKTEKIRVGNNSEEFVLRAIFGEAAAKNTEVRMPLQDTAQVVAVEHGDSVIEIYLLIRRQLRVGDILKTEMGNELVVAKIVPNMLMPLIEDEFYAQMRAGMVLTSSEDTTLPLPDKIREYHVFKNTDQDPLHLRADSRKKRRSQWKPTKETAPVFKMSFSKIEKTANEKNYSSSSLTRLIATKQLSYGCKISPNMLAGMISTMPLNAQEMLTLKSDDINGLENAIRCILQKKEVPTPGKPKSVSMLVQFLAGFGVKLLIADNKESITLKKMTDDEVRNSSHGEVLLSETLDYKKHKPVKGGLFDSIIFGSRKEYECDCGKYKGVRYKGITCDKCGVTCESKSETSEYSGHFELVLPIINPMFMQDFESLHTYLTVRPENVDEGYDWQNQLEEKMEGLFSKEKDPALFFTEVGISITENSIMKVLPIVPVNLRPLFQKDDSHWYSSDLNDLYRRVIIRSNRIKSLIEIKAPSVILRNEYIMLLEAVRTIFNNRKSFDENERLLKSLAKNLQSTTESVFKKPVVYSGKALVVPTIDVSTDEIFIPKFMALNLFKPRICAELITVKKNGEYIDYLDQIADDMIKDAESIKEAMEMVDNAHPKAIKNLLSMSLPAVVVTSMYQRPEGFPVFGFKPKIWDEEVIGLHPNAITELGLDLGDKFGKVFVSVPFSDEAIREAEEHMLSCTPVFKPKRFSSGISLINFKMLEGLKGGDITIPLSSIDKLVI